MRFVISFLCLLVVFFSACDDTVDSMGSGMMPDGDKISVSVDTIAFDAITVKMDSIYAKSIEGYLGELYDPIYGSVKAGYLSQFFTQPNGMFPDSVVNNRIDSVQLQIGYYSWIGDSLSTMEVSVYPVTVPLSKNGVDNLYYSTMNPADYCDMSTVLGRKTYTARDLQISDSIYDLIVSSQSAFVLSVDLPIELGERFLAESRKENNAFSSKARFTQFFPGLYMKTTFGKGNLIPVAGTDLLVYYNAFVPNGSSQKTDTAVVAASLFNITKEVIQINQLENMNDDQLLQPDDQWAYIKSPGGIFTQLSIPIPELAEKFRGQSFSNVQLSLFAEESPAMPDVNNLTLPSRLVLIEPDSIKSFFENQLLTNNRTNYAATLSNYGYRFGNISYLIQQAIERNPDENLNLMVVPVASDYYYDSYGSPIEIGYTHLLRPSGLRLKKGEKYMKMSIIATERNTR